MFDLVIACLADHVFSIRDAACKTLQQIVDIFGLDWAKQIVMPKVFQLAEEKNYLRRMTMLFQINYLMSSELSEKVLFSSLIRDFHDFSNNYSKMGQQWLVQIREFRKLVE